MSALTKGLADFDKSFKGKMDEFEKVTTETKNDLLSADKPSMSSTPMGPISFGNNKQGDMKAFTKNLQVQMSPELIK